jgi:uncharacterized protein (DUF1330 family)
MAAYLFADIEVIDRDAFAEYLRRAPAVIAAYGGRYLARAGAVELFEGEAAPNRVALLEFPDMERLRAFYHSAEYRPLLAIRERSARSTFIGIEGVQEA